MPATKAAAKAATAVTATPTSRFSVHCGSRDDGCSK
jgi:hypothetical protein